MSREDWNKEGQNDLVARATEYCKDILEKATPLPLPDHVIREMDSIVERADRQLGKN
jgi:trimethylamine:corrinoid methyltransferase-like protein